MNVFYCYLRTKWKPIKYRKCVVYRKYFMRFSWCIILDMQITSWKQPMKYFQSKFINHIQTNKQKSQTTILNGKVPIRKLFRKGNICSNHLKMCLFHFWWIFFLLLLLLFLFCIKIAVSHQRVSSSISKSFELFASYVYIFFVCLCLLNIFIFAICKLKFVMWWLRRMI